MAVAEPRGGGGGSLRPRPLGREGGRGRAPWAWRGRGRGGGVAGARASGRSRAPWRGVVAEVEPGGGSRGQAQWGCRGRAPWGCRSPPLRLKAETMNDGVDHHWLRPEAEPEAMPMARARPTPSVGKISVITVIRYFA